MLVMALALHFIYSVSRVHNLALGAIGTAVAYALFWSVSHTFPFFLYILIPLVVALILGTLNFLLNELFTKKHQYLLALLTSFSFAVCIEAIISILFGTGGRSIFRGIISTVSLGNYTIPLPGLIIIGFGAFVALFLFVFFRFIPTGRLFRATAEDQFSAMSIGIQSSRARFIVYLFGSILVGCMGILVGMNTALVPTMGFPLITMAFVAFLVGGISDLRGTIVASYILSVIPELIFGLSPSISANWRIVFMFAIAFVALLIRPSGIFTPMKRTQ